MAELKDKQEQVESLRTKLMGEIRAAAEKDEKGEQSTAEDKQVVQNMEKALGGYVDEISKLLVENESEEVKELREKVETLEKANSKAAVESKAFGGFDEPEGFRDTKGRVKSYYQRAAIERAAGKDAGDGNLFHDMHKAAKSNDFKAAQRIADFEAAVRSDARMKAWATGDLEDVDLIVPDVQAALPFLAAAAKTVALCRELRTTSTSVEFPVYSSGLTVAHVAEGDLKPDSEPTFDLLSANVFTIAGLSEVPNSLLEDYPAARGWIASELGRATGVQENDDVLQGSGTGEPLGILNNGSISGRDAVEVDSGEGINGRAIIEAVFRALQDVRVDGLTEPTDAVMNPAVWTDIVLSWGTNIGYLYGPPGASDAAPKGEPAPRLLGVPATLDAYVPNTYGATSNQSPIIVGNFQDAIVLRRSPFRIDVDTSLGFKINTTWFRGEERMGFIVVRPDSFKVVTNVVPSS